MGCDFQVSVNFWLYTKPSQKFSLVKFIYELNVILQVANTPQVKVTSASSSPTEDQLAEAEQLKSDGMDITSDVTLDFHGYLFT